MRQIERSLNRISAAGDEKKILVRIHPEVALQMIEKEANFLKRLRKATKLVLDIRDDPLLREDEFRMLSGPAEVDVTSRYTAA
jgi:ribonuclease G